jgi:hypothetical protein
VVATFENGNVIVASGDEVEGIVAGACGNPAILAYANKLAPTDRPDIGYAMAQNEKGILTLQLFTDKTKGQLMLKAESKGKDGISYRAELKKAGGASDKQK